MSEVYEEAVKELCSKGRFRINPSLENIKNFLEDAGLKKKFRLIQVSGTNGKTSTSVFLSSLLRSAGLKVGLFVSPHVYHYGERIAVDGKSLSKEEFGKALKSFFDRYKRLIDYHQLTEFEILTAFCFDYFIQAKIDAAVFETGLGGKFDAVSALNADFGVLTGIGFDHTELLGNTLEEIAYQKLHPFRGKPLYAFEKSMIEEVINEAEILGVYLNVIKDNGAQIRVKKEGTFIGKPYKIMLKLIGEKFANNAVLSFEALKNAGFSVDIKALEGAFVPARFQIINLNGKTLILDGSHNPQAISSLFESFSYAFGDEKFSVVCGFMKDKDYESMMKTIRSSGAVCSFVTPVKSAGDRSAQLYGHADEFFHYEPGIEIALEKALSYADIVIITGSIYLCGDFIESMESAVGLEKLGYDIEGRFIYHN